MKRRVQQYAFVWYRPDAWSRLKATATDTENLEDTYEEWHGNAESTFQALRGQGMRLEKVEIDIEALLAWCEAHGHAPNAAARSTYAVHLLQERHQGQNPTQAKTQSKEKQDRQDGRAKGLSPKAQETAMAAEQLYREQGLPVEEIAHMLKISKSTLYRYLRHRGVPIEGKRGGIER